MEHYPILFLKVRDKFMVVHRIYPESECVQVREIGGDEEWSHSYCYGHTALSDDKFVRVKNEFFMFHNDLNGYVHLKDVKPFGTHETLYYYDDDYGMPRAGTFAKFLNTRDDAGI